MSERTVLFKTFLKQKKIREKIKNARFIHTLNMFINIYIFIKHKGQILMFGGGHDPHYLP